MLLLAAITTLVYINTFKNDYALDDFVVIKNNAAVQKGFSGIPQIFSTPYHPGSDNDFYRPLSVAMFAVEYSIWGFNPPVQHSINVLLFAACVIMLFLFLDRLLEHNKTTVAFIASLLFALHPIHTEVVANIKSRDEILCFFFGFLGLNLFMSYQQYGKWKYFILAPLALFLSYLSKETVITFLGIIPLVFFFYRNENRQRSIYITAVTVLVTLLFLSIRYIVLNKYHANNVANIPFLDNPLADLQISYSSRIATAIFILGYYARLLIMPYPLICDYSYNAIPFVTFSNYGVLLSLALYIFLLVFGLFRLFKWPRDTFAFAILFFLLTISLFSNIFFLISGAMAERFIFFSSVGFCLFIALLLDKWFVIGKKNLLQTLNNPKLLTVLVPLLAIYSCLTFSRNNDWSDSITLFRADAKKVPNNSRLQCFLGSELSITIAAEEEDSTRQKEIMDESIGLLNKAISIYPTYFAAHHMLGQTYFRIGQYDSAEVHDKIALQLSPGELNTLNNLAGVYYIKKEYPQSIALCRQVLKISPADLNTTTNMSLSYINIGQFDSAIYFLRKALTIDPSFNSAYKNMAIAYKTAGNIDSAKKYESIAQLKDPDFRLKW